MVCSGDGGVDGGRYGQSAGFADGYHGCCVLRAEDQVGGAGTTGGVIGDPVYGMPTGPAACLNVSTYL